MNPHTEAVLIWLTAENSWWRQQQTERLEVKEISEDAWVKLFQSAWDNGNRDD